jgi:glycosyltransferase involved in cell wall biosynthesis
MPHQSQEDVWKVLTANAPRIRRIILHVHRNPSTGVWAMMKNLTREQSKEPGVLSFMGVMADRSWIASGYMNELCHWDTPCLFAQVPKMFGTGAYLYCMASNPLRGWMRRLHVVFENAEVIVHSHAAWMTGGFFPVPQRRKSGFVTTLHGIADDHRLRNTWWLRCAHRFLSKRLCGSGSVLTAVSHDTTERAEAILGIPTSRFEVVYNGMPRPDLSGLGTPPKTLGLRVGHVGQMHPGKGWHLLLEAVDSLHKRGFPIHLTLAGAGVEAEQARIVATKRSAYVRYLGMVREAGRTVIPQLDALVLATWSEGMPMSIVEAFAAAVPVLATPVGGIPEMLADGVNGLSIERNAQSIETAIERLVTEAGLRGRLARGARATFEERFEINNIVARYNKVYERALLEA